ncbi:MAG: ATP-binding protein, partial [Actinomycetota bacterium]|nr:ATP-binding protein [Actinomycetota bacterium]
RWTGSTMWFDLAVCVWLVLVSGIVVEDGAVVSGRPFFATGYPLSAALFWGGSRGPLAGVFAGAILGTAHVLSRPLNGVALDSLTATQLQNVAGAFLNYIVAGIAVGVVSRVLVRSAEAVAAASARVLQERERTARLAEREKLARQIHDSGLQALSYVHKRARELSTQQPIPADEVAHLSEVAARQEKELRSLILRDPQPAPIGTASLREALENAARGVTGVDIAVSSVGPIWRERSEVEELAAAVRQALENAAQHSNASRVTVFADEEAGDVIVSVKDDGAGFTYDEEQLRRDGKAGILKSMKGRAEDLGGRMSITSAPDRGTEVEFRIPSRS